MGTGVSFVSLAVRKEVGPQLCARTSVPTVKRRSLAPAGVSEGQFLEIPRVRGRNLLLTSGAAPVRLICSWEPRSELPEGGVRRVLAVLVSSPGRCHKPFPRAVLVFAAARPLPPAPSQHARFSVAEKGVGPSTSLSWGLMAGVCPQTHLGHSLGRAVPSPHRVAAAGLARAGQR